MNGDLREAKEKLKEMAMQHDMTQSDCYNGIRHLSIIMLAVCSDTEWIKRLLFLYIAMFIGLYGVGVVT